MKLDSTCTAVVTGGASGLGEATARALAGLGVKIALLDINSERGPSIARELAGLYCHADVTSDTQVAAALAQSRAALGQERILVNCAGVGNAIKTASRAKDTGEIRAFPREAFEKIVQINLIGSFRCIALAAAGMLTLPPSEDGERGVIINTSSIAASDGQIGQAAYSASKAGVAGMTLPIARDLSGDGIRVNTILPGVFETPLLLSASAEVRAALAAAVPFPKRLGAPREFASLVLEICRNTYFNGETVRLDGAIRMGPR
jgi:NAD(P)-dependent dehydrogenase (short-subunit alcohol dehydrogenase family)